MRREHSVNRRLDVSAECSFTKKKCSITMGGNTKSSQMSSKPIIVTLFCVLSLFLMSLKFASKDPLQLELTEREIFCSS